jgi:predicted PurR-regulated permease PerM
VTVIVLCGVGLFALFAWWVIPPVVHQVQELARHAPDYLNRLQHASGVLGTLQVKYHVAERMREFLDRFPSFLLGRVPGITAGAGSVIFNVVTVAVLTTYFLVGLPREQAAAKGLLSGPNAERNARIVDESIERIGAYVAGSIFISMISGTLAFVVMAILGIPFAAALGLWVAITDLIPNIGAMLGAATCIIVALFSSAGDAVALAVYFLIYQRLENYLILPRVMSKAIDLSAPTVIIALLVGAELAGLGGALLALPIAAALKVVIWEVWLADRTPQETGHAAT